MTLVYERAGLRHPVTHAFVIGCGRFPADTTLNRVATVAGARAMIRFLADHADDFLAPIASIECLLSEQDVAPGEDALKVDLAPHDPRAEDRVDPVLYRNVEDAGNAWLERGRGSPDQMLFYMASHGIAGHDVALGLFEDVFSNQFKKWSCALNVSILAQGLRTVGTGRPWVFLDACQEVVPERLGQVNGLAGLNLIEFTVQQLVNTSQSFGLAGSRLGGKAWAPTDGKPPYFTQALLEGMRNACVEPVAGLGWAVTGERLLFSLKQVAEAALDWRGLDTQPLTQFNDSGVALLKVANPLVPVVVRTETEAHMAKVVKGRAVCDDAAVPDVPWARAKKSLTWSFSVEAHRKRSFKAEIEFKNGKPIYLAGEFDALPPGQVVVLREALP